MGLIFRDQPEYRAKRHHLLGLLGSQLASSASAHMLESASYDLGLSCHYQLIDIAGASRADLQQLLFGVRNLGFSGINVAAPYNEAVLDLLDDLSVSARAIGAVNTILVRDGKLIGTNTEHSGFKRAFKPLIEAAPKGAVAVIGAASVGKAVVFALGALKVDEIRIFDADAANMETLAAFAKVRIVRCASVEEAMCGAVGVINTTAPGSSSQYMPVPAALLHAGLFVVDTVCAPLWTPLLLAAKAKGAKVMTGRAAAVFQAADAFELFTQRAAPLEVLGDAFDEITEVRLQAAA